MNFTKKDTLCMKGIAILVMFFHHNYVGLDCWLNSPIYTLNRYLSMGRDRTSLYRYICIHFFNVV